MTRDPRHLIEGILLLAAALVLWVATLVWRGEVQTGGAGDQAAASQ